DVLDPVPVEQLRERLRLHRTLRDLVLLLLVQPVALGERLLAELGVHGRGEGDELPVRRPDAVRGTRSDARDLLRLAAVGQDHPQLPRTRAVRLEENLFAVRAPPRARVLLALG